MAATPSGKDKLLRHLRIFLGGYDISGDARSFDTVLNSYGEVDMTGWANLVKNFLADGARQIGVMGFKAFINDTASSGAFSILKDADNTHNLSILFGGGGEPAIPDPAYLLSAVQMDDEAGLDGGAGIISADFLSNAGQFSTLVGNPWGVVLSPNTSISATTTGASHDNGAATTNGGYAHLHITATAAGNFAFTIEDSANDSAFATIGTFTADGSAITSERLTISGTIRQYVRAVATRTGGTCTPVIVLARN